LHEIILDVFIYLEYAVLFGKYIYRHLSRVSGNYLENCLEAI